LLVLYISQHSFFLLTIFKIDDLEPLIKKYKELLLYFFVFVVLASNTINSIAKTLLHYAIVCFNSQDTFNENKAIIDASLPQKTLDIKNSLYMGLIFYRQLTISIFFLGIALLFWLRKKVEKRYIYNTWINITICCCYDLYIFSFH